MSLIKLFNLNQPACLSILDTQVQQGNLMAKPLLGAKLYYAWKKKTHNNFLKVKTPSSGRRRWGKSQP